MAKNKEYTTHEKIEKYLNKTITTDLTGFILSAQRFIDEYCERNFRADNTATARVFDGRGGMRLRIDDCVEITQIEMANDEFGDSLTAYTGATLTSNFKFLPNNAITEGKPINEIYSRYAEWVMGLANQKITAKWGYSSCVPEDISFVATVLASGMYSNYNAGGVVKSESIGQYSVSYDTIQNWSDFNTSKQILNSYKRLRI